MECMLHPSTPGHGDAVFEHIAVPPDRSFLWRLDDYPWRRSVWNYHPEVEIHFMRHSTGLAYVGDNITEFHPGQLVLIGANLPHNFVTPGVGQKVIKGREIVVQFDPIRLIGAATEFPELADIAPLLRRAALGLEFTGDAARAGARILERMGSVSPLAAFAMLLELLAQLAAAHEYRVLASQRFADDFRPGTPAELNRLTLALEYIQNHFSSGITLPQVARHVGLSESAFSRFFKGQTGNGFSEHVASLRIWAARRLIAEGRLSITDICFESGFGNISNFNRTFLRYTGLTPSKYKRALRHKELVQPLASGA
jgi:AraC-like DNA-binding protein/mannose-6-phosphate isomerase-like protein (cupin superfamily)